MRTLYLIFSIVLGLAVGVAHADSESGAWKKIDVAPGVYKVKDGNGVSRKISPSCSGGPVCTIDPVTGAASDCHLGNTQYSFYYKKGSVKNLLVYFDGGGACWDTNTCVTGNETRLASYVAELGPDSDPAGKGGLFNLSNQDNPYRDWSMVVVPYCTGDIHWGSNDVNYSDDTGAVTGTPGGTVTIHHRGFDNFLYVRNWIKQRFAQGEEDDGVSKILVTGSSAGAYGAAFAYPHLKQLFPTTKGYLMSDAGNGVVTDGFLDQAIDVPAARWGVQSNLAHWIPGMDSVPSTPANQFLDTYYYSLASYYKADRFSQYTTVWDAVQTLFYNIMINQNDIAAWAQITPAVYGAWAQQMVNNVFTAAAGNSNYRFYVAEGCNHTLLRFDDDYYKPATNQDVAFLNWFKALTRDDATSAAVWHNTFCQNCLTPPTQEQVGACLGRSFAH